MNQIKINIINSNIDQFKINEDCVITLQKYLNCGTYGCVLQLIMTTIALKYYH